MTLQQFVDKYNGKKWDWDNAYGAQCVDLFRFYNKEVLGIPQPKSVNGAKDFWSNYSSDSILNQNFQKITNTPEFISKPGDVMIWNGYYGQWGHIAIVTQADINNFTCLSQNDPTGRETHLKEYTYSKVYGVLRPKVQITQEAMPEKTITIPVSERDNLIERSSRLDGFEKDGFKTVNDVRITVETNEDRIKSLKNNNDNFLREMVTILDPNTSIEIADQDLVKNLAKKVVSEFSNVQSELIKKEKEWQQQEKSLENENHELEKQVGSLKVEIERLLKRVEQVETDLQNYKDKKAESDKIYSFIEAIKKLFERK